MSETESSQERNRKYYDRVDVYNKLFKKSEDGMKFKRLMDRVKHPDNIMLAYRNIKGNKGSKTASVDGLTIDDIKKLTAK